MATKLYIGYQEYGFLTQRLVKELMFQKWGSKLTHVYGPPRGGWPIAVHLAHHLNLKLITENIYTFLTNYNRQEYGILVCDDVVDSGHTLKGIKHIIENQALIKFPIFWKSCSLHLKPRACIHPDLHLEEVPDDHWIVYPWESATEPDKEYMKE